MKHLRRGLSIYKTGRSPFWHARIYDSLTKRYVVRSTKETNRLHAAEVAEEILADLKAKRDTKHAGDKDRSFEHYARICSEMKQVQSKGARNQRAYTDEHKILWRYDYNTVRPHPSLGNKTPAEARGTLEQLEGSAPAALVKPETDDYQNQTRRLSS